MNFVKDKIYLIFSRYADGRRQRKYLIHSENENYKYRYVGKRGIHHMFREINGGWLRTYTDAQLIGKHIKELKDE